MLTYQRPSPPLTKGLRSPEPRLGAFPPASWAGFLLRIVYDVGWRPKNPAPYGLLVPDIGCR
jgi:hypothetical protein